MLIDIDYVRQRNTLIPSATVYANQLCGISCKGKSAKTREEWSRNWNKTFSDRMAVLAKRLFK